MSEVLFHPKAKVADVGRLAAQQGCRLKAMNGRVRLVKIKQHADRAFDALAQGDCAGAIQHIRAASGQASAMEEVLCVG